MNYFHGIAIDVKKDPEFHTDSPADASISNGAACAVVWKFRLKGQGADLFKIETDEIVFIFLQAMKSPVMLQAAMMTKRRAA